MPTDKYRSRSLYESGFLNISFVPDLERDNEGIIWFIFPAEAEEKSKEYWKGTAIVNPKEFSDSIRTLKDRMSGLTARG